MLALYKTIPLEQIDKDAETLILEVEQFFEDNPDRKDCRLGIWYGKQLLVFRTDDIALKIWAAAKIAKDQ